MTSSLSKEEFRIIDANLNRLNEGIRVVEDIFRYAFNDMPLALSLKKLRHATRIETFYDHLLSARDIKNDFLRPTLKTDIHRSNNKDIIIANFKRAQEASRVLEELLKLVTPKMSETFKDIRYELYLLEKKSIESLT